MTAWYIHNEDRSTTFKHGSFQYFVKDYLENASNITLQSAWAEDREAFTRCFGIVLDI